MYSVEALNIVLMGAEESNLTFACFQSVYSMSIFFCQIASGTQRLFRVTRSSRHFVPHSLRQKSTKFRILEFSRTSSKIRKISHPQILSNSNFEISFSSMIIKFHFEVIRSFPKFRRNFNVRTIFKA